MTRSFALICSAALLSIGSCFGQTVVWSGAINADGDPSPVINLDLGKSYKIRASGSMDLGRWWQGGKPLQNDACYGFNSMVEPQPIESLKNSLSIGLSDGKYHSNHVYESAPFIAIQSGIHFWIYDINYNDNKGALTVEVIELPTE